MATTEQQIARLEDKLRRLRTDAKRRDRRDDTRRKILYGAAFLALADSVSAERRRNMMEQIDRFILRPVDREFLGLPPSPAPVRKTSPQTSTRALTQSLPFDAEDKRPPALAVRTDAPPS